MVKVKKLKDGQDAYLVRVEEKSIYGGYIVKKPHEATLFVSNLGDIKVKVRDFDEVIFSTAKDAEDYLFAKIDGIPVDVEAEFEPEENGCHSENKAEVDTRSDMVLELEEDDGFDKVCLFVDKLEKDEVLSGAVIAVVTYEGDIVYIPVYRNKEIGPICESYDVAEANINGFNTACEFVIYSLGIEV